MDEVDQMLEREERLAALMPPPTRRPSPVRRDIHCVSCGEEIPPARLAVSDSCLCVECLDQIERGMGR